MLCLAIHMIMTGGFGAGAKPVAMKFDPNSKLNRIEYNSIKRRFFCLFSRAG